MGREPSGVDFALIGHPESWTQVQRMMGALRRSDRHPLSERDVRQIFPWIPPRTVERLTVTSACDDRRARGVYVETFIPPDTLGPGSIRTNVGKVESSIRCAVREGARVASLGGFTSIVMERARRREAVEQDMALTTGNTLTAGFIIRGVERAADLLGLDLRTASILILGSTGDLGRACASYFGARAARLHLCARRRGPLEAQADLLAAGRADVRSSTDPHEPLRTADVVVAVASLAAPTFDLSRCRRDAIVCDAGYPKNLSVTARCPLEYLFWGGMGRVRRGWTTDGAVGDAFYRFPASDIAHGCMLEGMVLGLERRYESFSRGRGNITEARMEEILGIAARHGIVLAPLFNADGFWPAESDAT